jgi:hypothetical protein
MPKSGILHQRDCSLVADWLAYGLGYAFTARAPLVYSWDAVVDLAVNERIFLRS